MLNLGNGDRSAAQIHRHLLELMKLFEELGGIQQCPLGPNPVPEQELDLIWESYHNRAEQFLVMLASDMGFKITCEPEPQ